MFCCWWSAASCTSTFLQKQGTLIKHPQLMRQRFRSHRGEAGECSNHALIAGCRRSPSSFPCSVFLVTVMKCFMSVGGSVPAYTIAVNNIATSTHELNCERVRMSGAPERDCVTVAVSQWAPIEKRFT